MAEVQFDWDDLTIDEVCTLEDVIGRSIDTIQGEGQPQGKVLLAMMYIAKRREDPDFTLEDAGRLKVTEFNELVVGSARPTEASA